MIHLRGEPGYIVLFGINFFFGDFTIITKLFCYGFQVIQLLDKIKEEDAERERRRKERELETQSNPEIQ